VHTSVATDKRDFEEFLVEDNMHIAINLKDFKAAVAHAETANATITARYTQPCKPLQLAYEYEGVAAEFTIMTRGEIDDEAAPTSSRAAIRELSQRQTPAAPISVRRNETPREATQNPQMPPPPPRARSIRPLNGTSTQEHLSRSTASERPSASALSMEYDSLFVPADDDRQWDEMNEEEEEPQDILGWDASGRPDAFEGTLRDEEPDFSRTGSKPNQEAKDEMGIPPTQRISQVCSHFEWTSFCRWQLTVDRSADLACLTEMRSKSFCIVFSYPRHEWQSNIEVARLSLRNNPARRTPSTEAYNSFTTSQNSIQRDQAVPSRNVPPLIRIRSTIPMLAPSKGSHRAITHQHKHMLASNSELDRGWQVVRWELAAIIATPGDERSRIGFCSGTLGGSMYIDTMPTCSDARKSQNSSIATQTHVP
jgi:cell cycle checkpoint control protein RAD9A